MTKQSNGCSTPIPVFDVAWPSSGLLELAQTMKKLCQENVGEKIAIRNEFCAEHAAVS